MEEERGGDEEAGVHGDFAGSGRMYRIRARRSSALRVPAQGIDFGGVNPYCMPIPERSVGTRPETILFVDDDAELRAIVREQLEVAGYVMEEAPDGTTAMEMVQQKPYGLVLLDITMPGASGLDVLKFVKQFSPTCHVIMLTGVTGLGVAIESLKLGADDYITKPYNLEYLLNAIRRVLGG